MHLKDLDVPTGLIARRARGGYQGSHLVLQLAVAALDFLAVAATAQTIALVYYRTTLDIWWVSWTQNSFALMAASLFVLLNAVRGQYRISNYLAPAKTIGPTITLWGATFITLMAFAFVTKTMGVFSRATVLGTLAAGLPMVLFVRFVAGRLMTAAARTGVIPGRRVMLVGREQDISAFALRYQPWNAGLHIAGTGILPADSAVPRRDEIARIVAQARALQLDDVLIVVPWSKTALIDTLVEAFMRVPVAIHLGPERIFDRFDQIRISKTGGIASLQLGRPPLSAGEVAAKRAMDLVLASFALFALTPLFILIALAIRLDSPGPVIFRQRRLGFNQRAFHIVKFRTMTVQDDGAVIQQATRDDPRVTRVGRFMRRWNLDELPQLLNVIAGQMSLVGPRPHAIAHDREYDTKIALYARRHNVKPGITGWAQVHGHRGPTDTEEKMKARVEHDLYYIDNWSIMLDIEILFRTVLSRKAYRNAF